MQKYNGSLIRQFPNSVTGNSAAGVFVGVFISGTSTPATLYEDDDTGGATLPNPLITNNVGFYAFYAADGKYRIEFSATQYPDLEVQLLDSNQVVDEFGAGAGLIGQAATSALSSISADVAAVDASRVSGQSAMTADVTAVDNSRINAQNLISLDVAAVDADASNAIAAISLDVAAVDVAATNALAVEIPAQINRLGLQYPPIAYISGLTLDSHVKTYSYGDALYIWGGAIGTVTTGDFDETGWQPIQGDVQLRNDVTKGTSLIRDVKHLGGIFELGVVVPQYDGQQFSVAGFYVGSTIGGGIMVWNSVRNKADHNGGTVIAPEAIAAWDGTQDDLATLLNWTGSGSGCYVKLVSGKLTDVECGAVNGADNSAALANLSRLNADIVQTLEESSFSEQLNFNGFNYDLNGGFLKYVTDDTHDAGVVKAGITLNGGATIRNGTIYTSGAKNPTMFSSTAVVNQVFGHLIDVTIFSGLDEAVRHYRGRVENIELHGGFTRGFRSEISVDEQINFTIKYRNVGIPHDNMLVPASHAIPTDSRAVQISPTKHIESQVAITVFGDFSWKNGVWIGSLDNSWEFRKFFSYGAISSAGFWLNSAGAIMDGNGAGSNWEFLNCPKGAFLGDSDKPRGYNVAIFNNCHGATLKGVHAGTQTQTSPFGGDPVVVIANSDDVNVACTTIDGTVSVSVGEDNFRADRTKITGTFINPGWAPILIGAASGTVIEGAVFDGEQRLTSWAGLFGVSYGHLLPLVRVENIDQFDQPMANQDVTLVGNTVNGWFTHSILDKGGYKRLRTKEFGNVINAPMPRRLPANMTPFGANLEGNEAYRLIDNLDTDSYSFVGQYTISAGVGFLMNAVSSTFLDVSNLADPSDVDYKQALKSAAVVFYIKYNAAMLADTSYLRFGLTNRLNSFDSPARFYLQNTVLSQARNAMGRPWEDGEWMPVVIPLDKMLASIVTDGLLTTFVCRHNLGEALSYDIEITNPQVCYMGKRSRNYA